MPSPAIARHWNLDDIVKIKDFPRQLDLAGKELAALRPLFDDLKPDSSVEEFKQFLLGVDALRARLARLGARLGLMKAGDWRDETAVRLEAPLEDFLLRQVGEFMRPVEQWLAGRAIAGKSNLDEGNAQRLFAAVPELEDDLWHTRRASARLLSEAEEKIISHKTANIFHPLIELRDIAETEHKYDFRPRGARPQQLKNQATVLRFISDRRATHRRAAYEALLRVNRRSMHQSFLVYRAVVRDWADEVSWRGYPSAIAMRNFDNRLPDTAVETLLEVVASERAVFHEFFQFKARHLGGKKLSRFDLYAPPRRERGVYPLALAWRQTRQALQSFSPEFAAAAEKIVRERHLDTHPQPRKQSGAFCAAVAPGVTPYVFLNHTDRARDATTLAHELGHGVHFILASHLPASVQRASLPLSETASTLAEVILLEHLLTVSKSKDEQAALLEYKMADAYATVLRQAYITKFEIAAHAAVARGAVAAELSQIWLEGLREQFGSAVATPGMFRDEWPYIGHIFHTPFYCYAYSFGQLLALALYERYRVEGAKFVPSILRLLQLGGSADPVAALGAIGCDVRDREFWRSGFAPIQRWQKRLAMIYDNEAD